MQVFTILLSVIVPNEAKKRERKGGEKEGKEKKKEK